MVAGEGSAPPAPVPAVAAPPVRVGVASRQDLVDALARAVSTMSAVGDLEGARIALDSLQRLLGAPLVAGAPLGQPEPGAEGRDGRGR